MNTLIAEWRSKSRRWRVVLERFENGAYGYRADGAGGVLHSTTDEEAIAEVQALVDRGLFQPDANKSPMTRVV